MNEEGSIIRSRFKSKHSTATVLHDRKGGKIEMELADREMKGRELRKERREGEGDLVESGSDDENSGGEGTVSPHQSRQ